MRIGIFGGAFDPPHRGHFAVAERAREQIGLDRVLWIPTRISPHKETAAGSPDAAIRLALVRAALADRPGHEADASEVERAGVSYSIDTVRALRAREPGAEWFFLLGADELAILPTWQAFDELKTLVTFVVHARDGARPPVPDGVRVAWLRGEEMVWSSRGIRADLLRCRSVRDAVEVPVLRLIEEQALYGPVLKPGVRAHVETVIAAARELAARWQISERALTFAARCHDLYRCWPPDELPGLLEDVGEPIDDHERAAPILLHGRAAAARLAANEAGSLGDHQLFGEVLDAVRYHTTGAPAMTPLAEALLVADQVDKKWPSPAAVPDDRREAVRATLERKLAKLAARERPAHPRMLAAAAYYGAK